MKLRNPARWTLAMLLALAAAPLGYAGDRYAEGSFTRTLSVSGPVDLDVATGSGRIAVRPGDAARVEVRAQIRARIGSGVSQSQAEEKVRRLQAGPPIAQEGNSIRIGHIEDEELRRNVSISYELLVPAETRLRSRTGSGSQAIEGLRGPVEAGTGSGELTIQRIGSEVRASTGSGSIEVRDVRGSLKASTGSGAIQAAGIAGAVEASTGSGSVRVEQTAPGDVDVRTGSGGVELGNVHGAVRVRTGSGSITAQGRPAGDWQLHTSSGVITVRLPAEFAFDLKANTSSGSIDTAHPITVTGRVSRRELAGKVRGGGPLLALSTASGSIRIQ